MNKYIEQLKESIAKKEKLILDELSNEMKNNISSDILNFKRPEDKFILFQKVSDSLAVFHERLSEVLTEDERTYKVWGIPVSMMADAENMDLGDVKVYEFNKECDSIKEGEVV